MKGSARIWFIFILLSIVSFGMVGFIIFKNSHNTLSVATNTKQIATPTITVRDYAPSLSMTQKTTILIQLSDSSEEKYIVPTSQVDTYIKSLPEGYHVISKTIN